MFNTLRSRIHQGHQTIPDIKKAEINEKFRGLPLINKNLCSGCQQCVSICPTKAIGDDISIDLGKCIFCGDCERECHEKVIKFSNFYRLASTNRNNLIITENVTAEDYVIQSIEVKEKIKKLFGQSLKLRQVSAGGCNGCEMELNACLNVNFDMGRFGIDIVASPRHADGLIITGPITNNMAAALEDAYLATPDPKIIILTGSCAISGGLFQDTEAINRTFLSKYNLDLYIPGCPVHPLTIINGILNYIGN